MSATITDAAAPTPTAVLLESVPNKTLYIYINGETVFEDIKTLDRAKKAHTRLVHKVNEVTAN